MAGMPELIRKKRDGEELTATEMECFVAQVVDQSAQDSQIGAMLMAMYLRDLSDAETMAFTAAILRSGEILEWDHEWSDLLVDKHSTGGVGDKVSLVLAPALAACGLKVPMVSGRGLEFTGGTLDKLESIPGFRVQLDKREMHNALHYAGCFIAGASTSLTPADRILYRIRDVTATVNSMPLTTASIVSKKVAEGAKALVMDIKVGKGAFFSEIEQARLLAKNIITVSAGLGLPARAVITRMDSPLGLAVGNALEVAEAVECLRGGGPADVLEVTTTLGGVIMEMKGLAKNLTAGKAMISDVLQSGKALQHFEKMLECQGVMKTVAFELCNGNMWNVLPSKSKIITPLVAAQTGTIVDIDGIEIAKACWHLGAGRSYAEQPIELKVGVKLLATVGHSISSGEPWIEVHHIEERLDPHIRQQLERAVVIKKKTKKNARSSIIVEIM